MAEETLLSDELLRQLINVGDVDLVVAVPTHNDAHTVGKVVRAVRLGLLKSFPRERAVLVNTDAGSSDGSVEMVLQASNSLPADAALRSLRTFHTVTAVCGNGTNAPSALRSVLAATDLMQAKACAVISPSEHVTPDWVEQLLAPVYRKDFDLVTPLYRRHKFDGLLIKLLLFPLMRALLRKRIHEPFSPDFAFSGRLGADVFMREELWQADEAETGEALLLSVSAAAYDYRACEVFLGPKEAAGQATDLVPAMRQTVGTLFRFLEVSPSAWQGNGDSQQAPGEEAQFEIDCGATSINEQRLLAMFQSGVADLKPVLASILTEQTLNDLSSVAAVQEQQFQFADDLWAKTVYEFAVAHSKAVISRDHIIQALAPLYRGKAYEFVTTNREAVAAQIRARLGALSAAFERQKPYLLQSWNRNDGGKP